HSRSSVHKRVAYLNVLPFPPRRSSDLDPDRIGEYAHAFHRDTLAATADVPALEHFARSLSMVFAKVPAPEGAPPDSYTIDHSATIAVLDPQGRMAGIIQPPLQPKAIAADMAALTQASFK